MKGTVGDTVFADYVLRRKAGFIRFQNTDDLYFSVTLALHLKSAQCSTLGEKSFSVWLPFAGKGRMGRDFDAREAEWPEAGDPVTRAHRLKARRWRDIGTEAFNRKTGPCAAPLGEASRALTDAMSGDRNPDGFLFPHYGQRQDTLRVRWRTVCTDAKLGRLRTPRRRAPRRSGGEGRRHHRCGNDDTDRGSSR